jgi:hypothetical protein
MMQLSFEFSFSISFCAALPQVCQRAHKCVSQVDPTFSGLSSGDFCPGGRIWLGIEPPPPDEIRLGNQRGTVRSSSWLSTDFADTLDACLNFWFAAFAFFATSFPF